MNLKTNPMSIYESLETRIKSASSIRSLECADNTVMRMHRAAHITEEEFIKLDTLLADRMDELSKETA